MSPSKTSTLAFSVVVAAASVAILTATPAQSQLGVKNTVALQGATPGVSQSGHVNVSGTVKAGNFSGSGAGLHSLSGDNISSGIVSSEFLPVAVAMEDEGNVFSQTNTFNGLTNFNSFARFMAFTSVGRTSGALGSTESFGIGESATGYDGMYVKTSASGRPYYGYSTGNHSAWHDLNAATGVWSLNIDTSTKLLVNSLGIGINTAPPTFVGQVLRSVGTCDFDATNGGPDGVLDVNQYGTGSGIQAINWGGNGAGVLARSGGDPTGYGMYADHTGSGDGIAAYCFGWGTTSTGLKALGGSFGAIAESSFGIGVRGQSGSNWGVHGTSTASHGVVGESTQIEGVVGLTSGTGRHAVHGYTSTVSANGAYFVTTPNTGTGVGVIGQTGSAAGYGVSSVGRFIASGTKAFRIDHPLDPENKFLAHYCAEGPEPLNVYSGKITTGNDGYAWIELPDYFNEINRDPRVQLTVDDSSEDFVMAKVVGGVKANGVRIRTSKANVDVYWEVKAVRNDKFVQSYGAPVEITKTDREKGHYLHPELYGATESQALYRSSVGEMNRNRLESPVSPKPLPLPKRPVSAQAKQKP